MRDEWSTSPPTLFAPQSPVATLPPNAFAPPAPVAGPVESVLPAAQLQVANVMEQVSQVDEMAIKDMVSSIVFFQHLKRLVPESREDGHQGAFTSVAKLTIGALFQEFVPTRVTDLWSEAQVDVTHADSMNLLPFLGFRTACATMLSRVL